MEFKKPVQKENNLNGMDLAGGRVITEARLREGLWRPQNINSKRRKWRDEADSAIGSALLLVLGLALRLAQDTLTAYISPWEKKGNISKLEEGTHTFKLTLSSTTMDTVHFPHSVMRKMFFICAVQ